MVSESLGHKLRCEDFLSAMAPECLFLVINFFKLYPYVASTIGALHEDLL